ncbi:MAG: hypothetical protein JWO44_2284 [Bacteroidetes bacterium]|nr:hypothetical protein [Bacteroidota bacterium]
MEYDHKNKDNRIRRTKDRRALMRKMDEDGYDRKKKAGTTPVTETVLSGDKQEQEADAVAKKVVNGADATAEMTTSPKVQMKAEAGLSMAKSEAGTLKGTEQLQNTLNSSKGGGSSLDAATRDEMGSKMNADLSDVKIHTDSQADKMSEGINAKAFTHGQDIYFKEGNFDTGSNEGKELLAHELVHTVQQKEGLSRKIQKKDGDDERVSYNIQIPPGTTSKEGFRHYAELIIFGRVVNLDWQDSEGAAQIYDHIDKHIGTTVQFGVLRSTLAQYGAEPGKKAPEGKDAKAGSQGYNKLAGEDKKEIVDEINRRYYDKTGIKEGTAIQPGDTANSAVWNKFRQEVMAQKELIESLPPEMKKFIHIENGVKPEDFEKYAPLAELLKQLNATDFLDYQAKVNFETTDLETLRQSLAAYLRDKQERQAAAESKESLKTKLFGLEAIYKNQYRNYKAVTLANKDIQRLKGETSEKFEERKAGILANQQRVAMELEDALKASGFDSISQFETYIQDYTKAFEKETIKIAEEKLLRYRHFLYEEDKKLNDDAYVAKLFQALSASGAKDHYKNANDKDAAANSILGDDAKYAKGDRELKAGLHAEASRERALGNSAIDALPSALTQDTNFDKEKFASISSKEELKNYLKGYILGRQNSIDETWEDIHANPDHIYGLDKLLNASMQMQQIKPDSIYDLIIRDKKSDLQAVLIAQTVVLLISMLFLTVITFGAASPLLVAAAGTVSAGLSIYIAYEAIEDYKRQNSANEVGLLTNDPSLVWVVLAIVGAAADLAALNSALKAAGALSIFTKDFNAGKDAALLEKQLATIKGLDEKIQANIVKQARLQEQEQTVLKGFAELNKMTFVTIPYMAQTGELLARAVFAVRKGILSFEKFIDELKLAKVIGDTGLKPDELNLVKTAFEKAKLLAKDDKLAIEIDKAIAEGDFGKLGKLLEKAADASEVGKYTTKIKWGILDIEARPFGKGFWGKRTSQAGRVDAYELKINPNNESFYLKNSEGSFVQFENIANDMLQDGKLVMDKSSIYHVLEKPDFLRTESILIPAQRQVSVAKECGYKVEWLVSEQKAVNQLSQYFKDNSIDIIVKLLPE